MRKYLIIGIAVLLGGISSSVAQLNMTLLGSKTYSEELSDIWGYVDSLGNEYALVGAQDGVSIVDVTDPANPKEIWWFPGAFTTWRDLKVWNKHCYVTNESSGGMFIVDLSGLPDTALPATSTYSGSSFPFGSAHNIFIDENGVAYIIGADFGNKGAIMLDVATDPMNPIELGIYDSLRLHDVMARGDTLWGSAIYAGVFVVVDVSNKSNPVTLGTHSTPSSFTHNVWLSDDGNYLYTTDEKPYAFIGAYDVSDMANITELDRIRSNPGSGTIPHNTHFMNDYIITSYYRDGITVHDVTHPDNMIEVANYDTYAGSGNGFNGAWGVYPWLPSGNIIVSNIEDGLTIHGITYVRGCYLEGTVTDLFTTNPIPNATITFISNSLSTTANISGEYKTGVAAANTYSVEFKAPGYYSDTLTAIMTNGIITVLDAQLSSLPSFAQTGTVQSSSTGNPIIGATVSITNDDFTFLMFTDNSGNFTIPTFYAGSYNISVGYWGYVTVCSENSTIDDLTGNLVYMLDDGYYDDFSLDFGWTTTSTATKGLWEIGEPLGTTYNGDPANPDEDVQGDCGDKAWISGNSGTGAGDDDIDDGEIELKSPMMNLLTYNDPYIDYYTWFFNDGGFGAVDDTLKISITNGTITMLLEEITQPTGASSWVYSSFRVLDYLPLSATIKLVVEAADATSGGGHLVEAGFDAFRVYELVSVVDVISEELKLSAYPNPFSESLEIAYDLRKIRDKKVEITLRDIAGRVVYSKHLNKDSGTITIDSKLAKGIYILELRADGEVLKTLKVVKA